MNVNQINEMMGCRMSVSPENVKVGMMATMFVGSDRYAMVVVAHPSTNRIDVEYYSKSVHGDIHVINGIEYANVNSDEHYDSFQYSYRKNYRWMPVGSDMWGTCSIHVGKGEEYIDPSF